MSEYSESSTFFVGSASSRRSPWIQRATDKSMNGACWQTHWFGHIMCISSHASMFPSLFSKHATNLFFWFEKRKWMNLKIWINVHYRILHFQSLAFLWLNFITVKIQKTRRKWNAFAFVVERDTKWKRAGEKEKDNSDNDKINWRNVWILWLLNCSTFHLNMRKYIVRQTLLISRQNSYMCIF